VEARVITDEECRLWNLVVANEPGALEVYADWLLTHAPKRGRLLQKRIRKGFLALSSNELSAEANAWRDALGVSVRACSEVECDPLPYNLNVDADRIGELESVIDRMPFLHITLCCTHPLVDFTRPVFAKIRTLSIWAHSDEMDPDENYQTLLRTYFGAPVLAALCASPQLRDLEVLYLFQQEFGARCAAMVAAGPFRNLRELWISGEPIGDEGAIALANAPALATLRTLSLSRCKLGDAGAIALASSPHLAKLERLDVWNNSFGPAAMDALRARGFRSLGVRA
jgi:hypothetical protein